MNLKRQTWLVIFISAAILIGLGLVLIFLGEPGNQDYYDGLTPTEERTEEMKVLTPEFCEAAGGTWNPCGSACRTNPDAICIELCVEYCECTSDSECPSGYVCGDFVEGVGVCL